MELTVDENVRETLQSDLELEISAVKKYDQTIQVAVAEKGNGFRDLFVRLLKDEENHVGWLEAQLHRIEELGCERYLTVHIREEQDEYARLFLANIMGFPDSPDNHWSSVAPVILVAGYDEQIKQTEKPQQKVAGSGAGGIAFEIRQIQDSWICRQWTNGRSRGTRTREY
jgi:rubrerythrin